MGGGAPESSVGATRRPPFWSEAGDEGGGVRGVGQGGGQGGVDWGVWDLTIGLLWLVTRGGGVGGLGQGGGQGGVDGGGYQRAVREQQGVHF